MTTNQILYSKSAIVQKSPGLYIWRKEKKCCIVFCCCFTDSIWDYLIGSAKKLSKFLLEIYKVPQNINLKNFQRILIIPEIEHCRIFSRPGKVLGGPKIIKVCENPYFSLPYYPLDVIKKHFWTENLTSIFLLFQVTSFCEKFTPQDPKPLNGGTL